MMNFLLIGAGQAGNKAVISAIEKGAVREEDTILINSTDKDISKEYNGQVIITNPNNVGAGKEQAVAKNYTINAIKSGLLSIDRIKEYDTVIIATSTEGGTGSATTPIIAKFFSEYYGRNVHVIAFTGFESDVRGISNTIEFFKSLDPKLMVQTISNSSFMKDAGNNTFKAEQMANDEMTRRIVIMSGQKFIESEHNIDDTDLLKVSNTAGYMTVEHIDIRKPLVDQEDFNKYVKQMIYNSHSIKPDSSGAARIGVILNIDEASEDAVDYTYSTIVDSYGKPYEIFLQKQWDGRQEYIELIVGGMKMPIDRIQEIYNHYKEETEKVNKASDSFYARSQEMVIDDVDGIFNMISEGERDKVSIEDFLANFGE